MDAETEVNLLDLINSQADAQVPYREGCTFFPPLEFLFDVLGMPELPKQRYELNRQPGWLTWKTFSKWMCQLPAAMQLRPSQIMKLSRMLASNPRSHELIHDSLHENALWKPYTQWLALIHNTFKSDICRSHWSGLLESEWQLMCKILPAAPTNRAKLEALANSPLMLALGAPGSQARMLHLLAHEADPDKVLASSDFINFRLADLVSFLLRFSAWHIADGSMSQGDREGTQIELLLETLLPVRQKSGSWTDAVESCLQHFARICHCPANETLSSSLGRMWAEHDYQKKDFPEVSSRQHTLRDWLSGDKGRPKRDSVMSLATAVVHKAVHLGGLNGSNAQDVIIGMAYRLHFAETSRYVLGEMQKRSCPEALIEAAFSSYALEFSNARKSLGVPLG